MTSRALKITKIADFPPNKLNLEFVNWARKVLITIHHMLDRETLKSLIPDYIIYTVILDYILTYPELDSLKKTLRIIENVLIKAAEEKLKVKILIHICKCLQSHLSDNSFELKEKWELEANTIIEEGEWVETCEKVDMF